MRKLIAIGGGEIGRPGYPIETTAIDKEIIKLSGKKHPKFLFVPTASRDAQLYIDTVKKYFGKKLGCKISVLLAATGNPGYKALRRQVLSVDIIYVGGGNTLFMMKHWRKLGIDRLLREAYAKGIILSGLSAGAICWFKYGCSDSRKLDNPKANYIRLKGLGLINATVSPHHIREPKRKQELVAMIKQYGGHGLAIDDYAALEILDNKFRVITSKSRAEIHQAYFQKGRLVYKEIPKSTFYPLREL